MVNFSADEQLGLLTNLGILSALMLTVLISSETALSMDEWYNKDYRWELSYSREFRLKVLQYLISTETNLTGLTIRGANIVAIDSMGLLDVTAALSQHVPAAAYGLYYSSLPHWEKIMQIDRVYHATRDIMPNNWKLRDWTKDNFSTAGRYWMAVILLGLSCIGSMMLYAAINISGKKEIEQQLDEERKIRTGNAQNGGSPADAEQQTCFASSWKHVPSSLTVSMILLTCSLAFGIFLTLWGLLDVAIARFPHGMTVVLTFNYWGHIWGWIPFLFYFFSSVLTFRNGNLRRGSFEQKQEIHALAATESSRFST